ERRGRRLSWAGREGVPPDRRPSRRRSDESWRTTVPSHLNSTVLSRARLLAKYLMFPGTNWISRDKSRVVKMFLSGPPERPVRTLDCGCGNAYFTHQAVLRGSSCLGITIHDWERAHCEEMREYLGIPAEQMTFRTTSLAELTQDPLHQRQY